MSNPDDLDFLDATAQAELVRKKEVKPIELVEAAIARIERLNPELNAVVTPMFDLAREAASAEISKGPFSGVPFLLKDLLAQYAGVRLTGGSKFSKDYISDHDSELVERLKQAGLIICGKTNTCEWGSLPTTEPLLFGPTRNPWNTDRTPGGSSGGSAAAVAAGMVPMAHGNDGGGSIRMPAACCGVFGLKPTRARNPLGPKIGDALSGIPAEHALTRSVRDSAALLDATAGPDLVEPLTWALIEKGCQTSAGEYLLAVENLQRISRDVAKCFTQRDVWLTPTLAEPPVALGTFDAKPDDPLHGFFRSGKFMPFTSICNVTGQPAMSVPLVWNDDNLPIGTHFIGRFGDEATLFRLAAQLEAARPWAERRPPVSA
jgi:Asp-tRNA(Asn)/Glu-tRNA(Gln) amidotransferase A subunit family amidase